jgi:hypothetical protein
MSIPMLPTEPCTNTTQNKIAETSTNLWGYGKYKIEKRV